MQRGTGTRAGQGLNRPVAGKTGTTNDYMDNWFVGFTPDIVIAVWLGFDDPKTLGQGETGGQNAAPIFRDVLEAALRGSPPVPFRAPPGVALVRVQVDGGASIMEAFRPGTENAARPPEEGRPSAQVAAAAGLAGALLTGRALAGPACNDPSPSRIRRHHARRRRSLARADHRIGGSAEEASLTGMPPSGNSMS